MRYRLLMPALLAVLAACSGGGGTEPVTPTAPTPISATGSWMGISGSQVLAVSLLQNGASVAGSGTLSNTATGLRALVITGSYLTGSLSVSITSGNAQPFNLQGAVTANAIAGSLSGSGFNGDVISLNRSGSTTANAAAWAGTYALVSVNGASLPASYSISGFAARAFSRVVTIAPDGSATWRDSTTSTLLCIPASQAGAMCSSSGTAISAWLAMNDNTLRLVRSTNTGYVVAVKTFVKQSDGSLLKNDDGQAEVYRKQ